MPKSRYSVQKQIPLKHLFIVIILLFAGLTSCDPDVPVQMQEEEEEELNPNGTWRALEVFPQLRFEKPVEIVTGPEGSGQLYVVEQAGVITAFLNDQNFSNAGIFLDIRDRVTSGGELGLLGMALHPQFDANGQVYVHYTRRVGGQIKSIVSLFPFPKNGGNVDKTREEIIISYDQPFANHNAGSINFGKDGYLYITTGDGGSAGDPQNNSQNLQNLLGKILRIDVDRQVGNQKYVIPQDNPFTSSRSARHEIYAYGLRNPWKMTMDRETGLFWMGDVGQDSKEEINILESGANYGWRITEGFDCYNPASNCDKTGLTDPVFDYGTVDGRSITGGYVYRGEKYKSIIEGQYIYGDYVSGSVWALDYNGSGNSISNEKLFNLVGSISSFGETDKGELLLLNYQTGRIHELFYN